MTDFLIGHPDIPFRAESLSCSVTPSSGYEAANIATGDITKGFQVDSGTSATFTFDMGVSETASAEYLYIVGAKILHANAGLLQLSQNGSPSYQTIDTYPINYYELVGPRAEDFFAYFDPQAAARYWEIVLATGSPCQLKFQKLFLGNFFDFGREPSKPFGGEIVHRAGAKCGAFNISLTWEAISNAKVQEFTSKVGDYTDTNPVVLYDSAGVVFPGFSTLYAKINLVSLTQSGVNETDITIDFEELI